MSVREFLKRVGFSPVVTVGLAAASVFSSCMSAPQAVVAVDEIWRIGPGGTEYGVSKNGAAAKEFHERLQRLTDEATRCPIAGRDNPPDAQGYVRVPQVDFIEGWQVKAGGKNIETCELVRDEKGRPCLRTAQGYGGMLNKKQLRLLHPAD